MAFDEEWAAQNAHRNRDSRKAPPGGSNTPVKGRKTSQPTEGKGKSAKSEAWADFTTQLHLCGVLPPVPEYRFHPTRKWRFDGAWPILMIAVEIDGGVYTQGRHTRGKGYEADIEKFTEAMLLGWTVYRFTTGQVESGYASKSIQRALEG